MGAFALASGKGLFWVGFEGVLIHGMNGFWGSFLFLPLTLFSDLTVTLRLGSTISAACYFVPALLFFRTFIKAWQVPFLFFSFYSLVSLGLSESAFRIHVDAPALGSIIMAAYFLLRSFEPGKEKWLRWSGVFAALSVQFKIIYLPVPLVLAFTLALGGYRKECIVFLAHTALVTVALLVPLAWRHELGIYWKHIIVFSITSITVAVDGPPHPWSESFFNAVKGALPLVQSQTLFLISPLTALWPTKQKTWPVTPLRVMGLLSLGLFPMAVMGANKYGSEANFISVFLYSAVIALLVFLEGFRNEKRLFQGTVLALALVVGCTLPQLYTYSWPLNYAKKSNDYVSWQAIRKEPGKFYFPEFPLSHFLAEKMVYHSGVSVQEINKSRLPMKPLHFFEFAPKNPEFILVELGQGYKLVETYYPAYREVPRPETRFAGWRVFARP